MNGGAGRHCGAVAGRGRGGLRLARTYAHTRQQFGVPIERLPAVAEMVTDMKIDIEAARALAYETSRVCDHENNNNRVLEWGRSAGQGRREAPQAARPHAQAAQRHAHAHEQILLLRDVRRVAHNAIQVLGGSGYMKDYAAERYIRDSPHHHDLRRHQPVAGRGGGPRRFLRRVRSLDRPAGKKELRRPGAGRFKQKLVEGKRRVLEAIQFVKTQGHVLPGPFRPPAGRFGHCRGHRPPAPGARGQAANGRSGSPGASSTARCRCCV